MIINDNLLSNEEKAIFALRTLYSNHGYSPYKMSKFEAYDLYVRNKDFLVSDEIITFTDTNGRLMALKPDVTLSIIKNSKDLKSGVQKLYYNENVYRVSGSTHAYREIMQAGLECIGETGDDDICEVVRLAAESLTCIGEEAVLDLSHMGIVSAVVDELGLSPDESQAVFKCIGEKNIHEMCHICECAEVPKNETEQLCQLMAIHGEPETILPELRMLLSKPVFQKQLDLLEKVTGSFFDERLKKMLRIDFSVVNNMKYYNGIVFKGFVKGIPTSLLSGGQYDGLMKKMHRPHQAIGFAVYLDELNRLKKNDVQGV